MKTVKQPIFPGQRSRRACQGLQNTHKQTPKQNRTNLKHHYGLGSSSGSVCRGSVISQKVATQQNQSQNPHKPLHPPPRTWPNSSTSFYNTFLSLFLASYIFLSHSLVAPGTRRVQADQYNTPKTSVKMSSDVSVINYIKP